MEYLTKKNVKPHKAEFKVIIDEVEVIVKKKKIEFNYVLIGSAKRNLVLMHENKGYDCDYKIAVLNDGGLSAELLKREFQLALDSVVVPIGYSNCQDSTQALTFQKVDEANSKIEKGFDVIITKEYENGTHILRYEKNNKPDDYHFTLMPDTSKHAVNRNKIKGSDMWIDLREMYKNKRNNEVGKKKEDMRKGYQLLNEAVHEVLQKYKIPIS